MPQVESPGEGQPLRRFVLPALFVLALFAVLIARRPAPHDGPVARSVAGEAMGTTWSVAWVEVDSQRTDDEIRGFASGAIERVNAAMSTYVSDSELSRFNRLQGDAPMAVGEGFREVFTEATRISELSSGAFDVTVAPLVGLWGFGAQPNSRAPTDQQIEEARGRAGVHKIVLDSEAGTLRKVDPRVTCDLSAIAKGYAVDQVAEALQGAGVASYMVELGGEIRARGERPGGGPWRVGVETPDGGAQDVQTVVGLRDASMATSGDYRNFVFSDGERISHTIDPRTGRPVRHGLASVSVIHPSCMTADALATALNVMGAEEGLALAEREGLPALFIERTPDGSFRTRSTRPWTLNLEQGRESVAD